MTIRKQLTIIKDYSQFFPRAFLGHPSSTPFLLSFTGLSFFSIHFKLNAFLSCRYWLHVAFQDVATFYVISKLNTLIENT